MRSTARLVLKVVEAAELWTQDSNLTPCYCRAFYGDALIGRTSIRESSPAPKWNERITIPLETLRPFPGGYLFIQICQQDDDVVGATRIPLSQAGKGEDWYPLVRGVKAGRKTRPLLCLALEVYDGGVPSPQKPSYTSSPSTTSHDQPHPLVSTSKVESLTVTALPAICRPVPLCLDDLLHTDTALAAELRMWTGGLEEVIYVVEQACKTATDTMWEEEVRGHLVLTDLRLIFLPLDYDRMDDYYSRALYSSIDIGAVSKITLGERRGRTSADAAVACQVLSIVLKNGRQFFFRFPSRMCGLWSRSQSVREALRMLDPSDPRSPPHHMIEDSVRVAALLWDEMDWLRSEDGFVWRFAFYHRLIISRRRRPTAFPHPHTHTGRRDFRTSSLQRDRDFSVFASDETALLRSEYHRLGLPNAAWAISAINERYALCDTYPPSLCFPSTLDDDFVWTTGPKRSRQRVPTLTWLHPDNDAPLCRCSQVQRASLVDFSSGTDGTLASDEILITEMRRAAVHTNTLRIVDARPRLNAHANVLLGKGIQDVDRIAEEGSARMQFANIENIHRMRESLARYASAYYTVEGDFWSFVASSKWLTHVRTVLQGAVEVAEALHQGEAVLLHCSDGWDRTSQLSALGQMLLDPYTRTFEGFAVLIQKDWCDFGHKFQDRCHSVTDEQSPIFLQFLDVVYQLLIQFPLAFEFSSRFLIFIADAVYSRTFSTFLGNSPKERAELRSQEFPAPPSLPISGSRVAPRVSLWSYLQWILQSGQGSDLFNPLYQPKQKCDNDVNGVRSVDFLRPCTDLQAMQLWRAMYERDCPRVMAGMEPSAATQVEALLESYSALLRQHAAKVPELRRQLRQLELQPPHFLTRRQGVHGCAVRQDAAQRIQTCWRRRRRQTALSSNRKRNQLPSLAELEALAVVDAVVDAAAVIGYKSFMASKKDKIKHHHRSSRGSSGELSGVYRDAGSRSRSSSQSSLGPHPHSHSPSSSAYSSMLSSPSAAVWGVVDMAMRWTGATPPPSQQAPPPRTQRLPPDSSKFRAFAIARRRFGFTPTPKRKPARVA